MEVGVAVGLLSWSECCNLSLACISICWSIPHTIVHWNSVLVSFWSSSSNHKLLLAHVSEEKIRENIKGTSNSSTLSWIWKFKRERVKMQEGGLGGILRRPNLPEAAGWLLCKRSYPHETTQRRDWVILILWTEYDWGESHPSSLLYLRPPGPRLPSLPCLAPWKLSALAHFLLWGGQGGSFVEMCQVTWCQEVNHIHKIWNSLTMDPIKRR